MLDLDEILNRNFANEKEKEKQIEELQKIADYELDKGDDADFDLVDRITDVVIELKQLDTSFNEKKLREKIIKQSKPKRKRRKIAIRAIAAVLSVIVLLTALNTFSISAYSSNVFESFISILDKGAVKLGFKEDTSANEFTTSYYDADKLANFVYKEIDVIPPLPLSLGNEFKQDELSVTGNKVKLIYSTYSFEDITFSISIKNEIRNESTEGNYLETYSINGTTLYITKDDKYYNVFCEYEGTTISYTTNMEYDNLIKILNNIV